MSVVVVESPAKARTISAYLGDAYTVLPSYGHVRDLPPKDGSVDPDDDFAMIWQVDPKAGKHLDAIARALRKSDKLYLATDPDREGEAISWHVCEALGERKALGGVDVNRIVFHEVTRDAVLDALRRPRQLDHELVEAYLARRALDYLVGFTLSPVLWRKLPGARSAGRVQSVALRLVCEREVEIERFRPREYWSVDASFATARGAALTARLTHLDGRKLDRFALGDEAAARAAVEEIRRWSYRVASVERKTVNRQPQPPFTTSTLQQEASRKLGFGATRTMRVAQRLYEGVALGGETVGLITYMRTDSVNVSGQALAATRGLIEAAYGREYVPERPHVYRTKARNAQEAHEAIRPTDVRRMPAEMARHLDSDQRRLYELIWKRAVASAMRSAVLEQVSVDVASPDRAVVLRAVGSVVTFDGFLKLYQEGRDDAEDEDGERRLPPVAEGEDMTLGEVEPERHFTKPPPRYGEASLVKRLEELGIGRPSTYASILAVLQDRDYVRLEARRFVPEDRGRLVTAFLTAFFERYVEYDFTAELEDRLDDVSNGALDWRSMLREFWSAFSRAVGDTSGLRITDVLEALDAALGPHFFPTRDGGADPRACPSCAGGRLGIRLGRRHGAFIGCSNYPDCTYTRALAVDDGAEAEAAPEPRELGVDPGTGETVSLRKGPFGFYVQRDETAPAGKRKAKPKRASLLKSMDPAAVTLDEALGLLSLPREVGRHPADGDVILAGLGRFGPYLKHGAGYTSLGPDEDVLSIGLNRAVALIDEAPPKQREAAQLLRVLGPHPEGGSPVELRRGRYGPYVKHERTNASLPKGTDADAVTLDVALELIAARAARGRGRTGTARKPAAGSRGKAARRPASGG